jgi:hypothetical protein
MGDLSAEPTMGFSGMALLSEMQVVEGVAPIDPGYCYADPSTMVSDSYTQFAPQLQDVYSDPLLQQGSVPGLAAGAEDWALQGVDWAFFENLMRGSENEGNEERRVDFEYRGELEQLEMKFFSLSFNSRLYSRF